MRCRQLKAVRAPEKDIEKARLYLVENDLFDASRRIKVENGFAELPVKGEPSSLSNNMQVVEQQDPVFRTTSPASLEDMLGGQLSEQEVKYLPRSWQILGDIIIVHINQEIEQRKEEVGEALLRLYPRCRTVLRDMGTSGAYREPMVELIAGDSDTETVHHENRCHFKLDAGKIMFSPGNLQERMRMSRLGKNETIVDMFAGIGYFSIPMAVHSKPRKIISIELNPTAYQYLLENIRLNKVRHMIAPIHGDCAEETPSGIADRVIMGHVHLAHKYLEKGIGAVKPEGGVLHYHEAVPEPLLSERPRARITAAAEALDRDIEIIREHKIKKYAPGVWHAVLDVRVV